MNYGNYVEEIDLIDLVKYLLSKWKWFVVSLLVGVVVFDGYAFYNNYSNKAETVKPLFTFAEKEKVLTYFEYQDLTASLRSDLIDENDYQTRIDLKNLIISVQSKMLNLGLNETQLKKIETYNPNEQSIYEFVMSNEVITNKSYNLVKQAFYGGAVGCFTMCAIFGSVYVLSETIKTRKELKTLGLFVLGSMNDFEVISSYLKEVKSKEIAYVSTLNLSTIPSNIPCIGNPLKEIDSLKLINNKDIVLVEKLKESNRQSIIDLKDFFEYSGFKIIGVILL